MIKQKKGESIGIQNARSGFSLVELVIAIAVFISLISGVFYLAVGSYTPFIGVGNSREMARYAQEAEEAVKIIKDKSWSEIVSNATGNDVKALKNASGDWILQSGTDTRGAFTRSIKIASVARDGNGAIAESGTDDPATKKVTVTISGTNRNDYKLEFYITNWEAGRFYQTSFAGSAGVATWTDGSGDYDSETGFDTPTTSGRLELTYSPASCN